MGWYGLSRKGQINTLDFLIAILVYTVLLIFIIGFWFVSLAEIEGMVMRDRIDSVAITISDMLLKTPGVPDNWEENSSNAGAIGLVWGQNVLDGEKLSNFTALDYNVSRELLGVDGDFYFYVEDLDGNRLHECGVPELGEGVAPILRFGMLDGEIVRMEVFVHE